MWKLGRLIDIPCAEFYFSVCDEGPSASCAALASVSRVCTSGQRSGRAPDFSLHEVRTTERIEGARDVAIRR